jgi:hypothetical protein
MVVSRYSFIEFSNVSVEKKSTKESCCGLWTSIMEYYTLVDVHCIFQISFFLILECSPLPFIFKQNSVNMKYSCSYFVFFAQCTQKEYIYILKSLSVHMHVSNQEPLDGNKNMADARTCELWRESLLIQGNHSSHDNKF